MSRTVFVTGGAGYVGSHCCKAFAEAGWNVIVYDNLSRGWRQFVRWGPLIEGDLLDLPMLTKAMQTSKPDAVIHFAALAYVGESLERPDLYYRVNSTGTYNVLHAMREAGVSKIMFSSTCATYGEPTQSPIDESHAQRPINPYGWSKLIAERMIMDYAQAFGSSWTILRYFNAAGADPNGKIGEKHEPETHVIPLAIRGAMSDDYTFTIYGGDYDTRDGTAIRDYIHVGDLADAHLRALKYLASGAEPHVFNLGTGVGVSVGEIADAVEAASGRRLLRRLGPRRQGDPATLVASGDKARRILGWQPKRSAISEIVTDAWRWHASVEG